MTRRRTIVFRCDGAPEIGFGHVVRCLALADELRRSHRCRCLFVMHRGIEGFRLVRSNGFPVVRLVGRFERLVKKAAASAVVLDVRDNLPRSSLRCLRRKSVLVVTIDDLTDRRLDSDLAFYPPIPQLRRMKWAGFTGRLYSGWKWVVLRRQFAQVRESTSAIGKRQSQVLVTMGGSDSGGLTLKAVRALDRLDNDFDTVILLGPGFLHEDGMKRLLAHAKRHFIVKRNVSHVAQLMRRSDIAAASFGVTAYELAACGVPAMHLCLTPDHAASASAFAREKMAVSLGVHRRVSVRELASAVRSLLRNARLRREMSERCRRRVDGRGAERIASVITAELRRAK